MRVHAIWLTLVVVLMFNVLANPLLEGGLAARTLSQQNMKCNTRSAFKRITMSNSVIYDQNARNCDYTIRAFNTKICQVRIDFIYLELDQPQPTASRPYGYCGRDYLKIDGLNFELCGRLLNQHVYVPFDVNRLTDEMVIDFRVSSSSFAMWNMEINQIECGHKAALVTPDERQEPPMDAFNISICVDSFNFGLQYIGGMHYAICFNRNYNQDALLELSEISFKMDGNLGFGFDLDCLDDQINNAKDYIAIPFAKIPGEVPHSLFCDKSLDTVTTLSYNGAGPMVIHVNTDRLYPGPDIELGFSFRYRVSTFRQ